MSKYTYFLEGARREGVARKKSHRLQVDMQIGRQAGRQTCRQGDGANVNIVAMFNLFEERFHCDRLKTDTCVCWKKARVALTEKHAES